MGRIVEIVEKIPYYKQAEAHIRMQNELLIRNAYDLVSNNCEIVANRAVGNPAESKQVAFFLAIATLICFVAIASA